MKDKKQIAKNSLALVIEQVSSVVAMLFMTPFLISHLGTESYGLWILTVSMLAWFNIADLGFPHAIQRFITYTLEKKDYSAASAYYSTGVVIFGVLGCIATTVCLSIALFPSAFDLDVNQSNQFTLIIFIFAIKVFSDFLTNVVNGVLVGTLRLDIDAYVSVSSTLTKLLLIYLFLPTYGIVFAAVATVLSDVCRNLVKYTITKIMFKEINFDVSLISSVFFKDLFNFAKHVITIGIAGIVKQRSTVLIIAKINGLDALASYSICSRLIEYAQNFIKAFLSSFGTVFTKMDANQSKIDDAFNFVSSFGLFLSTTVGIAVIFLTETFISLWLNTQFENIVWVVFILTFNIIFRSYSSSIYQIMFAQANHKYLAWSNIISALFSITLSIGLAIKFGLVGAVIGRMTSAFLFDICLALVLFRKYNKVETHKAVIKLAISIVILTSSFFLSLQLQPHNLIQSWHELILFAFMIGICGLIVSWFVFLDSSVRTRTKNIAVAKFNSLSQKL